MTRNICHVCETTLTLPSHVEEQLVALRTLTETATKTAHANTSLFIATCDVVIKLGGVHSRGVAFSTLCMTCFKAFLGS